VKEVTEKEFFELFDPVIHERLAEAASRYPDAVALVCYENMMMDSSNMGARSSLVVGPSNTTKTIEEAAKGRLGDVPSRFQEPRCYVRLPLKETHHEHQS
jgi:hypothetical protein